MILLLIVLVAAFNIVSTLTMVVADKTKEIGILKAMGCPRNRFAGSSSRRDSSSEWWDSAGLILDLPRLALDKYQFIKLDARVYFIDHLPVTTQPMDVMWIVIASIAIAAIATVYPSVRHRDSFRSRRSDTNDDDRTRGTRRLQDVHRRGRERSQCIERGESFRSTREMIAIVGASGRAKAL